MAVGEYVLHFGTEGLRALTFLSLVFGSQATIYALRERGRLWGSRPSAWLVASSVADVLIASILAILGIAMASTPAYLVACMLAAAVVFAFVLDLVKRPVFARLKIT